MLSDCNAGEDSWEFINSKEIKPINPKGNQSWIFTGRTDAEAEAPILWPPDAKSWPLEKTLMLGKMEGKRRRGWQRMRWLDGNTDSIDVSLSEPWETLKNREAWHAAVHEVTQGWTRLRNWTTSLREGLWLVQGPRNCLNCPEVVLGYGVIDSRTELFFYSAILVDESINNTCLQAYFNLFLPNSL